MNKMMRSNWLVLGILYFFIISSTLSLSSCGGSGGGGSSNGLPTNGDTTRPTVNSITPTNGASGVSVNTAIMVTFSETIDATTINAASFVVSNGISHVAGSVAYSGTSAVFTPSGNLSYSTTYTATITTGVKDAAGNAMACNYAWTFTTGTVSDTTPPIVSSVSPVNNATSVAVNGTISAVFSEAMNATTITASTLILKDGSNNAVSGTVSYGGTTATFTPSGNLSYSTTYTVTITTGVKDSAGNAMVSNYVWTFSTGTVSDTTPPTVSSVSPVNNATSVAVNGSISAVFSEAMNATTITASTLTLKDGNNNAVSGTVSYNGTTATFTPSTSLNYSTTYTVTITTGVKDSAGNAMVSNYVWTFSTGTVSDTTPPTVSSVSPVNNATSVAVNGSISAVFSEAMNASTITTTTMTVKAGATSVSGTVGYSGTTATFTPSANLSYSTVYTVTITSSVKDLAGNALSSNYSWTFTTGTAADTTPPTVISVSPVNNGTVAVNGSISAVFSETMNATTITSSTYIVTDKNNNIVNGTLSYSGTTATFMPSSNLSYNNYYGVTITTGVKDLAGNAMASKYSWLFFPENDVTPPSIPTGLNATVVSPTQINLSWVASTDNAGAPRYEISAGRYGALIKQLSGTTISLVDLTPSTKYCYAIKAYDAASNFSDYSTEVCATTPHIKCPDTGQTICHDSLGNWVNCTGTGEDGAYTINAPSYTDNGNGIIMDNITGLMWQSQGDGTVRTWGQANAYCSGLALGGYTGWRLPTDFELMTIVNYGAYFPAINRTFFPIVSDSLYWSSTTCAVDSAYAWYVDFFSGQIITYTATADKLYSSYNVMCVKGNQFASVLVDNGNGTITDSTISLMWQKQDDGTTKSWDQALSYCEGLSLAGFTDWRLPNVKELRSIIDTTTYSPAINQTYFPNTKNDYYWSSSDPLYGLNYSKTETWSVRFDVGYPDYIISKTANHYVRCTRGGQ